jgi:hypothetical protein
VKKSVKNCTILVQFLQRSGASLSSPTACSFDLQLRQIVREIKQP